MRGNKRIMVVANSSVDETEAKSSQRRTLMDLVVETVSKCSEEPDDNVQLQVRIRKRFSPKVHVIKIR